MPGIDASDGDWSAARAEGFAAGRLAGIEEARRLFKERAIIPGVPLEWERSAESRIKTLLAKPAPAAASEPRSEAAECTCVDSRPMTQFRCHVHGKPGAP